MTKSCSSVLGIAGHCYCAISALSFLGRLPSSDSDVKSETGPGAAKLEVPSGNVVSSISSLEGTVRWLVFRQLVEESEEDEDEQTSTNMPLSDVAPPPFNPTPPIDQFGEDSHAAFSPPAGSAESHHASDSTMTGPSHTFVSKDSQSGYGFDSPMSRDPCTSQHGVDLVAGFNGRCNKSSDTCYSFWVCGALAVSVRLFFVFLPPPTHLYHSRDEPVDPRPTAACQDRRQSKVLARTNSALCRRLWKIAGRPTW